MEMLSSCLSLVARSSRSCEGKAGMRERDASPRIDVKMGRRSVVR